MGRQVELTTAGHQLLGYAAKLMEVAEEAKLAVSRKGEPAGPLTVSASESRLTYRMPELLRTFQCRYPAVSLSLHASEVCTSWVAMDAGVDVALTIDEPVKSASLIVKRLRAEPMVSAVAADHPLAKKKRVEEGGRVEQQVLLTKRGLSSRGVFLAAPGREGARSNE